MTTDDERPSGAKHEQDFRRLPPEVRTEETVAGVEPNPVPDPDAVRNVDQHRALRDD